MAVTRSRAIVPKVPTLDELDEAEIALDYDRATDTLAVTFTGSSRPAITHYADDDTIYRLDPETAEVIGLEIEDFLARLLRRSENRAEA